MATPNPEAGTGGDPAHWQDPNAIYHDASPRLVLFAKIVGGITALMLIIALIITLARGPHNSANYLLTTNLVISAIIGFMMSWWYRKGDLMADKTWFLFLVAGVILFQCITVDIYAFHSISSLPPPTTTTMRPTVSAATFTAIPKAPRVL
ncbi:uncharacterized protein LOC141903701 [Tubulanus polymorphus]|uniref:uncharacterized protein LOC141903701 n=1 Tax=Tubulanus polymorphus TaxID=672921 RepID=UPI003DA1CB6F